MGHTRRLTVGAGLLIGGLVLRHRVMRLGATQVELALDLPGDDVLPFSDLSATRAITVDAAPVDVWPWLAQLGWGRGGFYSYDALENLVGLDIRSADQIVPAWQDLEVGDQVHLAPQVALDVRIVDPGRALVLAGVAPDGETAAAPYDFTWAFVLRPGPVAGTTRLVVRERYSGRSPAGRALVEAVSAVSALMSSRMLRGIRDRAQRGVGGRTPVPARSRASGITSRFSRRRPRCRPAP
ncbi:SRPBCC family protein [Cellulomonas sp. Marseille-Q8402]